MKFSIIPWVFRRSYDIPELDDQPHRTTVGMLVRSMHRHERELAERRDNLEAEIKRLSEELRQTNVANATYLAGLKALAADPALTEEERMMATHEIKIDEAMLAAIVEQETAPRHFVKPNVTLADVVTEDALQVVEIREAREKVLEKILPGISSLTPSEISERAAQVERAMRDDLIGGRKP